jgi:hypothetical protein
MSSLVRIRQVAACTILVVCVSASVRAEGPQPAASRPDASPAPPAAPAQLAPNVAVEIAHSALLSLSGTVTADALKLQMRRVADKSPISSDGVTATVDGKSVKVSHVADGYELSLDTLRGGDAGHDVELVVPHDGIRELLSGKVALAQADSGGSFFGDHKQIVWWLLNIVVVFVAATAISRRKG